MTTTTLTTDASSHEPVSDGAGTGPREVHHVKWIPFARHRDGQGRDMLSGTALTVALSGLLTLAVGMGYVSFKAQRQYVLEHKASELAATVEALGLDAGAVIFAALAFAAALSGRAAVRARVGNLACVGGSLAMNLMSANPGSLGSLAVWGMPAALYAFASDTLIGEVRLRALEARGQNDSGSAFVSLGRSLVALLLWLLRLVFDVRGTVGGFRTWVLLTAPVAPRHRRHDLASLGQQLDAAAIPEAPQGDGSPSGELAQPAAAPAESAPAWTLPVERVERSAPRTVAEIDGTLKQRFDALVDELVDSGQLNPHEQDRSRLREHAHGIADAVGLTRKSAMRYLDQALTRHTMAGHIVGVT